MNILITGGNGYIAKSIYNALKDKYNINIITRNECDLTDPLAVNLFFSDKWFDVVIHCAVKGGSRLQKDNWDIMDINLSMYYNLLSNKNHYNKFIHFGSGAEVHMKEEPYGFSKNVIHKSILSKDNFYNVRIFGVFDENELDTRFIKANIKKYINKEPILIYENKKMSFFYMKDLIMLIEYIIINDSSKLIKENNCDYIKKYTLLEIAQMINKLDNYKVPILIETELGKDYVNEYSIEYDLPYIGLEKGIIETYNKLK